MADTTVHAAPQSAWAPLSDIRRDSPVAPGLLAAAATVTAVWPYTAVVQPGGWTGVVIAAIAVTAITGIVVRLLLARRSPALRETVTLIAQLLTVTAALTTMLARQAAMFGFVPTPTALRIIGARLAQAADEVADGVAPLAPTASIAVLLGLAFGGLAIVLDQLVALRCVIATALVVAAVGCVPMVIVSDGVNVPWFVLLAGLVLVLFRYGARHDAQAPRHASAFIGTTVGAMSVVAALVIAPGLPVSASLPGLGPGITVDASLRLGDDLRRPESVQVLSVVTEAAEPPYLRMATLSRFTGEVWRPDRPPRNPVSEGFGSADWDRSLEVVEANTSVRVVGMSSSRLPVPYAADEITGVDDDWSAVPSNRTVVSSQQDAAGADYTVTATTVDPTLQQIRASRAGGAELVELPEDLPPSIAEAAATVTARATNDYDRLIAMQSWFRTDFTYSLETPVEDGFDGTGADAVASFLEVRSGYCIHFAGAFALMATTLGMPVRIVVGYLPGSPTEERRGDDIVYQVDSDQLHSWPEVHFEGIGWVPFEPTATLGVPTAFAPAAGGGSGEAPEAPEETIAPSDAASPAPTDALDDPGALGGAGGELRQADPWPFLWTMLGLLVLALLPGLARLLIQAARLRRAHGGDALAAWTEVQATMVDLRLPVSDADTPRERGVWIVSACAVDAEDVATLVGAVERAAYSRDGGLADGPALNRAVTRVDRALRASASKPVRFGARLLPRSLVPKRADQRIAA